MNKDAILRLKQTTLFKDLIEKEKKLDFGNSLSTKVIEIVEYVAPLLTRIPENMPEYTLHDPNHGAKVVENMGKIIPNNVLTNLNIFEVSLLILSGYIHDVGMTCSKDEKEEIIKSNKVFDILFKSDKDKYEEFQRCKEIGDHRCATFIEDQIFTEYLRRHHVERSANFINNKLSSGRYELSYSDIPFWKSLASICDGHGEPVNSLRNIQRWPRHTLIGENIINVQYLSLLLRLADILDLDPERTPKIIYEYVNPKNPTSIIEWKKHRSVLGYSITNSIILFEAECTAPEVERALKEFLDWIEIERKETIELLREHQDDISQKYYLELNEPVTKDRVHSDGSYISNDLKFEIDYKRVLDLLMGQKLYKNPIVVLRELLQNSVDAIKTREALFKNRSEKFEPLIIISLSDDIMSITDNGVGMDESIFKNFFLQVGKSFYSSPIFYSRFSDIDITSEFGIGVLSTFMVADSITVESRREPENPLKPPMPIHFEIPTAYSYTVQRKTNRMEIGTKITMNLKKDNPFKEQELGRIIKELMPLTPYKIEIRTQKENTTYEGILPTKIFRLPFFDKLDLDFLKDLKISRDLGWSPTRHCFLKINFENSGDPQLENIVGDLYLINRNLWNWESDIDGFLAQRNFRIGIPELKEQNNKFKISPTKTLKNILPCWLNYYSELNLTKNSCLSVIPDRTDVIVDEKFKILKSKIEHFIIQQLKVAFDEYLLQEVAKRVPLGDLLIVNGIIGFKYQEREEISSEAIEFLSEYITFPILNFQGEIVRKKAKDIRKEKIIGYSEEHFDKKLSKQTVEFISNHNITLILLRKLLFGIGSHHIDNFVSVFFANKTIMLSPHIILTSLLPEFALNIIKIDDNYRKIEDYNNVHDIRFSFGKDSNPILFVPRHSHEMYPRFNISHPLINFAFDIEGNYKTNEAAELFNDLARIVNTRLSESLTKISKIDPDISQKLVEFTIGTQNRNIYKLTEQIFNKDREFLTNLINDLTNFWNSAKLLGLINAKKIMPVVGPKDFLHYWKS